MEARRQRSAPDAAPSAPSPELARLTEWDTRLSSLVRDVNGLHSELGRLRRESEAVAVVLEGRNLELSGKSETLARLEEERARLGEERAEALASLDESMRTLESTREHVGALEQEREVLRARVAELEEAAGSRASQAPVDPPSHVCLVPLSSGYELLEVAGPPPSVGRRIELDAGPFSVAKVGTSPLPGDERSCVFLLREHTGIAPPTS